MRQGSPQPGGTSPHAAIVVALEALEVGDQALAIEILQGALEDGAVVDPDGRRRRCDLCGYGPAWPGELEHHMLVAHPTGLAEAA